MIKLSELKTLGGYELCSGGHHEFLDRFGDSATYEQAFTNMSRKHCVSFIIQLIQLSKCPAFIIESIPMVRNEENRKQYARFIIKNWDTIKAEIITRSQLPQ